MAICTVCSPTSFQDSGITVTHLDRSIIYFAHHHAFKIKVRSQTLTNRINPRPQALSKDVRGGADKSLARPGRKQATENKLGIYSTYSLRNSVHFLFRCSNFFKPLKKIKKGVRPTRSPWQQWPPRRTKNGDLSIVFSVQGTGGRPMGPDPETRVGDQGTGSPGRPISSGLQVPGEPGHCRAKTRSPW